jgi:lactate dehydrogenase-like 2-hydroxyacid dehydrogenase
MRDGALLVNVARPGAWDAPAVLRAREAGRLGGVATDVLGPGLSADELMRFVQTCCVTPLVAGGDPGRLVDEFDRVGAALLAPLSPLGRSGDAPRPQCLC